MAAPPPHRPFLVRAINRAGAALQSLGLPLRRLDEAHLLEAARRATGLDDFGGEGFREGLRRLVAGLEEEAALNTLGRIGAHANLLGTLVSRLRLQEHRTRHPELEREPIRRPLFILGLPRTGTTILFNLLAQDPTSRAPLSWEVQEPCPPPRTATYASDPRIAKMARQFANLERMAPTLKAIHEFGAELPQECVAITGHEFLSVQFFIIFDVPSYQAWVDRQSMLPALHFHRRFLQHLQSQHAAERWVLKTPGHLAVIEDLLAVYPDACIVHTHRDPVEVMPSLASLSYTLRGVSSDALDPRRIGRQQCELWASHLQRAVAARERLADRAQQFLDVRFDEVLADPLAVVQRIYRHFEIPLGEEARRRMAAYLAANPRGQFGAHRYSLEDFGLEPLREAGLFDAYCERFGAASGSARRPVDARASATA